MVTFLIWSCLDGSRVYGFIRTVISLVMVLPLVLIPDSYRLSVKMVEMSLVSQSQSVSTVSVPFCHNGRMA